VLRRLRQLKRWPRTQPNRAPVTREANRFLTPELLAASAGLALAFAGPLGRVLSIPCVAYASISSFQGSYDVWHRERRLNVDFLDSLAIALSTHSARLALRR
jgi:hypothetical protein